MKNYRCEIILSSIWVYFGQRHPANVSRIGQFVTDNNTAEAKAFLEVLQKQSSKSQFKEDKNIYRLAAYYRHYKFTKSIRCLWIKARTKILYIISKINQPVLQTPYTFELSALKYFMT
jgi:hypothetical protein